MNECVTAQVIRQEPEKKNPFLKLRLCFKPSEKRIFKSVGVLCWQARADIGEIKNYCSKECIDDSKYHGENFFGLEVLFEKFGPIAWRVCIFSADPDVGDFQLEGENGDCRDQANTSEDVHEGAST